MTFGEKLQQLRMKEGLSQDKLAEILDVSRQAVSKWERDETMPETEKVIRISDIFHVSLDYLLKNNPEVEQETSQKGGDSDFFSTLQELVKTRWYYIGYAVILWGAIDFLKLLATWMMLGSFMPDLSIFGTSEIFSLPFRVLWLSAIYGAVKIAAGIATVVFGKRYCKRKETI